MFGRCDNSQFSDENDQDNWSFPTNYERFNQVNKPKSRLGKRRIFDASSDVNRDVLKGLAPGSYSSNKEEKPDTNSHSQTSSLTHPVNSYLTPNHKKTYCNNTQTKEINEDLKFKTNNFGPSTPFMRHTSHVLKESNHLLNDRRFESRALPAESDKKADLQSDVQKVLNKSFEVTENVSLGYSNGVVPSTPAHPCDPRADFSSNDLGNNSSFMTAYDINIDRSRCLYETISLKTPRIHDCSLEKFASPIQTAIKVSSNEGLKNVISKTPGLRTYESNATPFKNQRLLDRFENELFTPSLLKTAKTPKVDRAMGLSISKRQDEKTTINLPLESSRLDSSELAQTNEKNSSELSKPSPSSYIKKEIYEGLGWSVPSTSFIFQSLDITNTTGNTTEGSKRDNCSLFVNSNNVTEKCGEATNMVCEPGAIAEHQVQIADQERENEIPKEKISLDRILPSNEINTNEIKPSPQTQPSKSIHVETVLQEERDLPDSTNKTAEADTVCHVPTSLENNKPGIAQELMKPCLVETNEKLSSTVPKPDHLFATPKPVAAPKKRPVINNQQSNIVYIKDKPYTVLSILGRGGSSEVYQVLDTETSKLMAMKSVNLALVDECIATGYLNEVEVLSKLQGCSSVIRMFDYEYNPDTKILYVVMEKGDTDFSKLLKDIMKTKKISLSMITYYWTEMLTCVKDIHDQGIIHSDLKPANFLLVSGRLKLIDFGIASSLQGDMTSVFKDITTGTFNYMSPEAIQNSGETRGYKITYKSDVWSLGCILYNLLFGRTPFSHISHTWKKFQAIADPDTEVVFPESSAPPHLLYSVRWALKKDPKARPTATELLQLAEITPGPESQLGRHISTLLAEYISQMFPNCSVRLDSGKK